MLGPLFFVLYVADVFKLACSHGFSIHGYADDLQIYDHCAVADMDSLTDRFARCVGSIQSWMSRNRLKLNTTKTEFIWFGSARRLPKCTFEPIRIGADLIQPSHSVRDLGVTLDPVLSLSGHVSRLVSNSYYQIRQLRSIRRTLTTDACHALARAMILSRLDYCNGLLGGASTFLLGQLSGVLRAAARLVLRLPRICHITDAIRSQLHWLDYPARVTFKLCVLAYRCLHGTAPSYLAAYCVPVGSIALRPHLRSSTSGVLHVPQTKTITIGNRAFAVACPAAWNTLPPELRDLSLSLPVFRKKLKTFLFNV